MGGRRAPPSHGGGGLSIPEGRGKTRSAQLLRPRALVVYAADEWPLRTAIADHLFAWQRHGPFEAIYFNAKRRRLSPRHVGGRFDLVVFHTTLLSQRWNPVAFEGIRRNLQPLKRLSAPRLAIPQDEFLHANALCDFLAEFEVGHVLSCARDSEWPKIYGRLAPMPRIATVLTGYLEPRTLARIERLRARSPVPRPIDIGYRAWRAQPWLGRHGVLKTAIGEAVLDSPASRRLRVDISLDERGTLVGDAWWRFLLACRYVVGVEGGASLLDTDGSVKSRTDEYLAHHPDATFDEVEAACFPGRDGELDLFAMSPRHLEACATRTGQLLVEGRYNGVLRPGEHFVPIRADLSNLEAVLDHIGDPAGLDDMTRRAYEDVIGSGRYTYAAFIGQALDLLGDAVDGHRLRPARRRSMTLLDGLAAMSDVPSRCVLVIRGGALRRLDAVNLLGPARRAWRRLGRMLDTRQ